MLFNSYIFVFVFLPCTLLAVYLLSHYRKHSAAKFVLVGMSLWFYAYFHLSYIFVILSSVGMNYLISRGIRKWENVRKAFLFVGVSFNVLLIFYYKYLDFTVGNINALLGTQFALRHILMPLGISFFTFQQIGYLVDTYYETAEDRGFLNYCLFITFFPQLIAGPIVSYQEMVPQFEDPQKLRFSSENFAKGLFWFACGLGKKVLIADVLGKGANWGYAHVGSMNGPEALLTGLLYTFQLYYDFSGYCDMACGIGKMFGIDLPINFLSPLKTLSIMEFWNRWHITLGRFLTGYVFNPLVMSFGAGKQKDREARKRRQNRIGNLCLFLTFFISGIWHGANWTFILWGILQGSGRVLYQIFRKRYDGWKKGIRWGINFVFQVFSMTLFGAASVGDFGEMLIRLPKGWTRGIRTEFLKNFNITELVYIEEHVGIWKRIPQDYAFINLLLIGTVSMGIALFGKNIYEMKNTKTYLSAFATVFLLVWSILSLSGVSVFLYFNF